MNGASVDLDVPSHLMLCAATRTTRRPDVQIRRDLLLVAVVAAALAAAACSPTQPTPKPTASAEPTVTASAEPTPEPSAVALEPTVNCQAPAWTPPPNPNIGPITLTCENAVAAARAVVGPDPAVTSIEFYRGHWCQPDRPCLAIAVLNGGYVIFRRPTVVDLVVVVRADKDGKVTAEKPVPIMDPGASQSDHPA
jgi:hypothetical protein